MIHTLVDDCATIPLVETVIGWSLLAQVELSTLPHPSALPTMINIWTVTVCIQNSYIHVLGVGGFVVSSEEQT